MPAPCPFTASQRAPCWSRRDSLIGYMRSYVSKSVTTVFARRQSLWLFDFKHKSISSLPPRDFSGWSQQAWWWRPFGRHILACVVSRWRTRRHMHKHDGCRAWGSPNAVHGRVGGRGVHVAAPSGTKATVQRSGKEQAKLDHQASLRHDQKRDGCGPTISCKVSWRNIASWGQALCHCCVGISLMLLFAILWYGASYAAVPGQSNSCRATSTQSCAQPCAKGVNSWAGSEHFSQGLSDLLQHRNLFVWTPKSLDCEHQNGRSTAPFWSPVHGDIYFF